MLLRHFSPSTITHDTAVSKVKERRHRRREGFAYSVAFFFGAQVGVPVIQDPAGVLQSRVELLRIVGFSFSLGFSFSSSLGFSFSFSSVSVSVSVSVAVSAQFQFLFQFSLVFSVSFSLSSVSVSV